MKWVRLGELGRAEQSNSTYSMGWTVKTLDFIWDQMGHANQNLAGSTSTK